jgi:7-carboxy-7-deazaguanine synthase
MLYSRQIHQIEVQMFGKNEIVGRRYFKDVDKDKLFVTSMFITLQGEGPYRGEPAFFIRLAKCNLACSFCDTFFDDGDWMTFDEIEEKMEETINHYFKEKNQERPLYTEHSEGFSHMNDCEFDSTRMGKNMVLVVTGGEPSLQQNLLPFLERMQYKFRNTQIESNGIIDAPIPDSTTLVISPKCLEKNGEAIRYIQPNQKNLERADCLKFVMSADPDSPYNDIPDWAHEWAKQPGKVFKKQIFISPMNIYNDEPQKAKELRSQKNYIDMDERSTIDEVISFWEPGLLDMDQNRLNHEYTAKFCIKHGYVFNMQLHLFASLA